MKLTNEVIGKYVMRTKPCLLGKEKDMYLGGYEEKLDYNRTISIKSMRR